MIHVSLNPLESLYGLSVYFPDKQPEEQGELYINENDIYNNTSMQYSFIFIGYKNDYFQMKKSNHILIFGLKIFWVLRWF